MFRSSTELPGLVPVLSRGKHRSARKGACFMEFAAYLAGERWSDHPSCTHPLLSELARLVNDSTSDAHRATQAPGTSDVPSPRAGERWSDPPSATHPLLSELARMVNDSTSDEHRTKLAALVPSVIGLTSDDVRVDARIALLAARTALRRAPARTPDAAGRWR